MCALGRKVVDPMIPHCRDHKKPCFVGKKEVNRKSISHLLRFSIHYASTALHTPHHDHQQHPIVCGRSSRLSSDALLGKEEHD